MALDCTPQYSWRPNYTDRTDPMSAPVYHEHRSRLIVGEAFFRSKFQSTSENDIKLEVRDDVTPLMKTLYVRRFNLAHDTIIEQEVFEVPGGTESLPGTCDTNDIALMRNAVNASSNIIEMTTIGYDIYDTRLQELACLLTFTPQFMVGGEGGPVDDSGIAAIQTGPERAIIIIETTEDSNGNDVNVPPPTIYSGSPSRRVQEWNGDLEVWQP